MILGHIRYLSYNECLKQIDEYVSKFDGLCILKDGVDKRSNPILTVKLQFGINNNYIGTYESTRYHILRLKGLILTIKNDSGNAVLQIDGAEEKLFIKRIEFYNYNKTNIYADNQYGEEVIVELNDYSIASDNLSNEFKKLLSFELDNKFNLN